MISLRLSLIQSLQCNAALFELTKLRIEIIEKEINFDLSFFKLLWFIFTGTRATETSSDKARKGQILI